MRCYIIEQETCTIQEDKGDQGTEVWHPQIARSTLNIIAEGSKQAVKIANAIGISIALIHN